MSVGVVDSSHFLASKHKNVIPILGELTTIWVLESGGSTTFYNRKESLDTCFPASTERQPNVSTSWVQIIRCTNSGLYLGASDSRKSRFTPGAVTVMAAVLDLSEEKWKWWPMRWGASGFGILAERHVTSIYSEVAPMSSTKANIWLILTVILHSMTSLFLPFLLTWISGFPSGFVNQSDTFHFHRAK